MDIKVKNNKGLKLEFEATGLEDYYLNTIRRLITDEVPTMAIEEVEFRRNDSALYDEMIALRLGLIPLKTDLKGYDIAPEGLSEDELDAAKYTLQLSLKTTASGYITADKIKSKDPKVVPVFGDMPITYLQDDQKLEFVAKARLGRGKIHSKWSPGHAWYHHDQKDNKKFTFNLESWGQLEPKEIIEQAIAEFDKKLDEFAALLKAL